MLYSGKSDDTSIVKHIRINYKSGSYIQTWFSVFNIYYDEESGKIIKCEWKVATAHKSVQNTIAMPLYMVLSQIESVWVMSTMDADKFYNDSYKV